MTNVQYTMPEGKMIEAEKLLKSHRLIGHFLSLMRVFPFLAAYRPPIYHPRMLDNWAESCDNLIASRSFFRN